MLILVSYMGLAYNLAFLFSSAQHFAVNLFFISSFFSQLQFTDGSQMSDFSQLINKQYICIYQTDRREKAYENLQITAKISLLQYAIQNRTRETTYTHSHHNNQFPYTHSHHINQFNHRILHTQELPLMCRPTGRASLQHHLSPAFTASHLASRLHTQKN